MTTTLETRLGEICSLITKGEYYDLEFTEISLAIPVEELFFKNLTKARLLIHLQDTACGEDSLEFAIYSRVPSGIQKGSDNPDQRSARKVHFEVIIGPNRCTVYKTRLSRVGRRDVLLTGSSFRALVRASSKWVPAAKSLWLKKFQTLHALFVLSADPESLFSTVPYDVIQFCIAKFL